MKDEIVYRKQGRRYVPIGICDAAASYWPEGAHLVVIEPGRRTTRYHVEPAMAALEAAARKMQDGMVQAMLKASEAAPSQRGLTKKELAGWEAYKKVAGEVRPLWLETASMTDIAQAGIDTLLASMIHRTEINDQT